MRALLDSFNTAYFRRRSGRGYARKKAWSKSCAMGAALEPFQTSMFIPMGNPVSDFVYHRSFSHSIFVLGALTPIFTWLVLKLHPILRPNRRQVLLAVLAVLYTHIGLDSITVYGTQIFWPISSYPVSIGAIFIVDPLYTLPLLIGSVCYLLIRNNPLGRITNNLGLIVSSLYLVWAISAQAYVKSISLDNLTAKNLPTKNVLVTLPHSTPFFGELSVWIIITIRSDIILCLTRMKQLRLNPYRHRTTFPTF